MSVVFFLPAFISPFFPTKLAQFVFLIDVIFSYLFVYPVLPIDRGIYIHNANNQVVNCLHLRGPRLQLALVLGQCTSRPGVFEQEGQRVIYLLVFVRASVHLTGQSPGQC